VRWQVEFDVCASPHNALAPRYAMSDDTFASISMYLEKHFPDRIPA
jgi:hypothetical protein